MNLTVGRNPFHQSKGAISQGRSVLSETRGDFTPFLAADIEQSIPERFERHVKRTPARLAAKDQTGSAVSYSELNASANRIARLILDAIGDGEKPVIIVIGQSVKLLAAILGVLKAGKFYVPVEIEYSMSGIQEVLDDTGATLLLTDSANHAAVIGLGARNLQVVNIEEVSGESSTDNIGLKLSPDRLAYVYYTSGSTGKPKGVMDCHRNVLHNIFRYTNKLLIGCDDRLSLVQSPSFSGAISNMFCALLNGASVFPYDLRRDGASNLSAWVAREELTMFHAVPTVFEWLCAGNHTLSSLRIIRLEGDQAFKHHIDLFKDRFDARCTLAVGLGATETGIATQFIFNADGGNEEETVPIGYPTEDVSIHLLDDAGETVEGGAVGEIAVESRYLAVGYWRRPDLTQSAFKENTGFGSGRIYMTGDLGRSRPDGCIDYLGRKEGQITLHGHSIDVMLVEETVRNHPEVRNAAIALRKDRSGRDRLTAYVVPKAEGFLNVTHLRSGLSKILHGPSLPTAFIMLNALPLTENKKLDRGALPELAHHRPAQDVDYAPPRDRFEYQMQKLWEGVLEIEPVGIHDNFFDLGGDSLSAATLFAAVDATFETSFPTQAIYDEGATVAGMTKLVAGSAFRPNNWRRGISDTAAEPANLIDDNPRREKAEPPSLMVKHDLGVVGKLCLLGAFALLPGYVVRRSLCRLVARTLMILRASRAEYLKDAVTLLEVPTTSTMLETDMLATEYEAIMETWRAYLPAYRPRKTRLRGRHHIDAALAAGHGAVLWECSTRLGNGAELGCLASAGVPIVSVRSYDHPFSGSRFGRNFLNTFSNRIDDRYVRTATIVHEENSIDVMRELGGHLGANQVVRISANGAFSRPFEIYFFGGTLCLALGAPTLALLHGAPLIPTFCIPDSIGGFELIVEEPLTDGSETASADVARTLAYKYAAVLERYLKRDPTLWQNWFMRNTWRAEEQPGQGL